MQGIQGCQIFADTIYQNMENATNDYKMYQIVRK
jgi:hypothetical protein